MRLNSLSDKYRVMTRGTDPDTLLRLVITGVIAILLIPAIVSIAGAKRDAVFELLSTAIGLDGPWEIQAVIIAVAVILFISIPTWGILHAVYHSTGR